MNLALFQCLSLAAVRSLQILDMVSGAESLSEILECTAGTPVDVPQLSELVAMLKEQCSAVSRILNDVLSLQKMEEGQFTLEMVPFSPERMVQSTVASFKAAFESRRQRVTVTIHSLDSFLGLDTCSRYSHSVYMASCF